MSATIFSSITEVTTGTDTVKQTHSSLITRATQVQITMRMSRNKSLSMIAIEPMMFDITPAPIAPSTPRTAHSRRDSVLASDHDRYSYFSSPQHSNIHHLTHSLLTVQAQPTPRSVIVSHIDALLSHLHSNPLTPPDAEVLIPALLQNFRITRKLAVNIGWHHGKGHISPVNLEAMLLHIFLHDETLFVHVTEQIERFRHLRPKQHTRRQKQAKPIQSSAPAKYLVMEDTKFLPFGCSCIADLFTSIDGLTWSQVKRIEAVARQNPRKRHKLKIWRAEPIAVLDLAFWARTRLHNGPGMDRKGLPKVRLPSKEVDKRVVLARRGDEGVYKWAEMEMVPIYSLDRDRGRVVVRMPTL
jgi:hypothetical protein